MTTITHLHPANPDAAAKLISRVPAPTQTFDRAEFMEQIPWILEAALEYLLVDIQVEGSSEPSAIGCRIIAGVIDRMRG